MGSRFGSSEKEFLQWIAAAVAAQVLPVGK